MADCVDDYLVTLFSSNDRYLRTYNRSEVETLYVDTVCQEDDDNKLINVRQRAPPRLW